MWCMSSDAFAEIVWAHHKKYGRHDLPWRKNYNPYRILVSELMLQQTQVDRVIPFYKVFLKRFPTAKKLAEAPLAEVLIYWNGLGYNRRAKFLHQSAQEIVRKKGVPKTADALESLPGVGPYTARAVAAFAYDAREVVIETNIRAVLIHHFFKDQEQVSDAELFPILADLVAKVPSPREWYSALMDYGTALKKEQMNPARRSKHHVKQSKFEGSLRQVRGAILKALTQSPCTHRSLAQVTGYEKDRIFLALDGLKKEGLVSYRGKKWHLGA